MTRPKLRDANGQELSVGSRVTNTNAETVFINAKGSMRGTVVEHRSGPPVLAVRWDQVDGPALFWHSIDLMWRCPDLELTQPEETQ